MTEQTSSGERVTQAAVPTASAPQRFSVRRMARLGLAFACLPMLMAFAARWQWICDLGSHFVVQSAVTMTLFLVAFAAGRDWRGAGVAASLLAISAARIVPLYFPTDDATTDETNGPALRILSANIHTQNRDASRILDLVRREDPDIVVLLEINDRWQRDLEPLKDRYPHSVSSPREDNFGIAFFTRLPAESIEVVELADSEVPTVIARLKSGDRPVTVIGTHPLPPTSGENTGLRNRQLATIGRLARESADAVIVAGDLNNTSWSPSFRDLLADGNLRDSRRGFGIQTTWPTTSPLLRIAIDHVLASRHFAVRSRRIAHDIGSDHLPVIVDLSWSK